MAKNKKKTSIQLESKRVFPYWKTLYLSFISHLLYWDVYKRWRGIGLIYLLFMISVFSIPYGIKSINTMRLFFNEQLVPTFERLPDIPYVNGDLQFDKKMPYIIKNDKGQVETIIDNTGTYKQFDRKKYPDLRFLFLNKNIYYTMPEAGDYLFGGISNQEEPVVRHLDVPEDMGFVFNGNAFLKDFQFSNLKKITLTAIYPIVASTFYLVSVVFLLPMAMMGQIVSQVIFKVQLYFKQSCRLLCVSSTPAFFVLQLMALGKYDQSYIGLIWLCLVAFYFSFAVLVIKRNLRSIANL